MRPSSISLKILHHTLSQAPWTGTWEGRVLPGQSCRPVLCCGTGGAVARTLSGLQGAPGPCPGRVEPGCPQVTACPQPRRAQPEHASAESLMECILESFAFLNADLAADQLSLFGGSQGPR